MEGEKNAVVSDVVSYMTCIRIWMDHAAKYLPMMQRADKILMKYCWNQEAVCLSSYLR